jgi:hypothetical protein
MEVPTVPCGFSAMTPTITNDNNDMIISIGMLVVVVMCDDDTCIYIATGASAANIICILLNEAHNKQTRNKTRRVTSVLIMIY